MVDPPAPDRRWAILAVICGLLLPSGREVLNADSHLTDPQVVHNGTYQVADHPTIGCHRWARYPARFS